MDACTGDDGVVSGSGNLWGSKACVAVAVSNRKVWVGDYGRLGVMKTSS